MTDEEKEQPSWSEDDVAKLIHLWNTLKKTSKEIGPLLGKGPGAILSKVRRLRSQGVKMETRSHWSARADNKRDYKEPRKCLKCRETFLSTSPFIRICPRCALVNSKIHDRAIMHSTRKAD